MLNLRCPLVIQVSVIISLEFKGIQQAGGKNVKSHQSIVVFKARRLDEITKGECRQKNPRTEPQRTLKLRVREKEEEPTKKEWPEKQEGIQAKK